MTVRKKRRKASGNLPPFVALTWDMLNSAAYKSLNYSAAKALPYFLGKYQGPYHDLQRYLFEFKLPYAEGLRYGFSSSTFSGVIQELVRKGFIDPMDKGGLRGDGKSCNLFKVHEGGKNMIPKDLFQQTGSALLQEQV